MTDTQNIKDPLFKMGDMVWAIGQDMVDIKGKCGFCGGTGKAIGEHKNEIKCPVCNGLGHLIRDVEYKWRVVRKFTVDKSVITTEIKENKTVCTVTYPYSDSSFVENQCFRTEKEAIITCGRLNDDTSIDIT